MTTADNYAIQRMMGDYLARQRWQEESILNSNINKYRSNLMNATAIETHDEQVKEFNRFLDKVLSEPYTSKVETSDDGLIDYARVNTRETIDKTQMSLITEVADSYRHDFQIERSGAGIKITFTLIED